MPSRQLSVLGAGSAQAHLPATTRVGFILSKQIKGDNNSFSMSDNRETTTSTKFQFGKHAGDKKLSIS